MLSQIKFYKTHIAQRIKDFFTDETADEILQKAAIIALATAAVIALGALFAQAVGAINQGAGWFGG